MEDDAQKMLSLKKAYAEIILNTAKEAATRVMASERKALRFQQDLRATKDEALRMLVRLKQTFDSKTTEAEMASLIQQGRIEELEAQLNEAEDVIAGLRTDLKQVWGALEKVKSNQAQPLNGQIKKAPSHESAASESIRPNLLNAGFETMTISDMKNAPLNERISVEECCNTTKETEQVLDNYYANKSDFASIIMKIEEPELYRKGLTQRVCAFERDFLDGEVPPSRDEIDRHSLKKNELISKVSEKDEVKCLEPSTMTSDTEMVNSSIGEEVNNRIKISTSQRRKIRFGKAKATSWMSGPSPVQVMKLCQPSSFLSCCNAYSVNRNVKSAESSCTLLSINTEKGEVCQGKGKEEMKIRDATASVRSPSDQLNKHCQLSYVLPHCRTSSYSTNGNVKTGDEGLKINETESKIKPLTRLDPGLTLITRDVDPRSGSANITVHIKASNESGVVKNVGQKDMELGDESALVEHEGSAAEKLMNPSSELNLGMVNKSLMNANLKDAEASEESNGSPSQAACNRLLRYTFQRKRKKEFLSKPEEDISLESSTTKRRLGENQSDTQKLQNSNLINDSSRDSRRLAQVARQVGFLPLPITHLIVLKPKIIYRVSSE
ncbi:hypothetical protein I3842_04G021500 [Carya illinoinensis]|uniref:Uncharacterized protein n=2 Tax=Carya illinoinensis TaxID=32201 RepID=A0A922F4P6_CARIL|nr:hypothetical protein I3842_04G021500 [Carya illinoinensis]